MKNGRQRFKIPPCLFGLSFVFLFHHTALAIQTQIFSGPVSMAMGGGGRAGAEATEKFFLNPAAVVLADGFEMGLTYRDGDWARREHETSFNLVLLENDPTNFAMGGFGYVQKTRLEQGSKWDEQVFLGALGQNFSPHLSLGASVSHSIQKVKQSSNFSQWNGSVGALITISPSFGLAYVWTNVVPPDSKIPVPMQLIPQQSLAMNIQFQNLARVTLDLTRWEKHNPDKKGVIQIGNEVRLGEFSLLRTGLEFDDIQKRNSFTAGFGFLGPRLRANYAFVKPFRETNGAMHSVDLRLPF